MNNEAHPIQGTSVGEAAAEVRGNAPGPEPKPVEEVKAEVQPTPVVVPPVVDNTPKIDGLRCSSCREVKQDHQLMKQPLDYKLNDDGSASPYAARYSLFCGTCQKFLGIYDPVAQKELADMIKSRNEIETRRSDVR